MMAWQWHGESYKTIRTNIGYIASSFLLQKFCEDKNIIFLAKKRKMNIEEKIRSENADVKRKPFDSINLDKAQNCCVRKRRMGIFVIQHPLHFRLKGLRHAWCQSHSRNFRDRRPKRRTKAEPWLPPKRYALRILQLQPSSNHFFRCLFFSGKKESPFS